MCVTPACDECSNLSMSSFLLFVITILPALRRMSPLSATLRSLQIFLNGAVYLFFGGAFVFCRFALSVAYSLSLCISDSIVVVAAKHCVAALIVSSSSIAWNVEALQRVSLGYFVLFAMHPFDVKSVFCQLLSYSQYSCLVHFVYFALE